MQVFEEKCAGRYAQKLGEIKANRNAIVLLLRGFNVVSGTAAERPYMHTSHANYRWRPSAGRECELTARRCETNYRPTCQRADRPTVDNSTLGKTSGDLAA